MKRDVQGMSPQREGLEATFPALWVAAMVEAGEDKYPVFFNQEKERVGEAA